MKSNRVCGLQVFTPIMAMFAGRLITFIKRKDAERQRRKEANEGTLVFKFAPLRLCLSAPLRLIKTMNRLG